jgi:hypothetical protein
MSRNRKTLHGRDAGLHSGRKDRADQSRQQYNQPSRNSKVFNVDQHFRAINRAMSDAYVILSGWPACIRYSYFVGPDGKLITRGERRAGA